MGAQLRVGWVDIRSREIHAETTPELQQHILKKKVKAESEPDLHSSANQYTLICLANFCGHRHWPAVVEMTSDFRHCLVYPSRLAIVVLH